MNTIHNWLGGKSTTFAYLALISAIVLAWFHRLDPSFAGVIVACQGLVTMRSIAEDFKKP
jgi:hypothetical protein